MTQITRWAELFDYPVGTALVDNMGDTWMLDSFRVLGFAPYLIAPETRPTPADYVIRHFGPLEIAYVPNERGLW